MDKGIGRHLVHEMLEKQRFRAIELRRSGWRVSEIAAAFGMNRRAVTRWFTAYKRGGRRALLSKKAPGPKPKLSARESAKIISSIRSPATKFGFKTPAWSYWKVQHLIWKFTGKKLSISSIWRLLRRHGVVYGPQDRSSRSRLSTLVSYRKRRP